MTVKCHWIVSNRYTVTGPNKTFTDNILHYNIKGSRQVELVPGGMFQLSFHLTFRSDQTKLSCKIYCMNID